MKKVFLFRTAKLFSTKLLGIVSLISVVAYSGYCQSGKSRVDINKVYESEAKRLLLPSDNLSTQTPVIVVFLAHPVLAPDYSICLKDSARQLFLELRLLDKNINQELMTRFMQKQSLLLPLKASVYKASVSKDFKRKMLQAFDCISPIKDDPFHPVQYDGITYEFVRNKDGKMKKISIEYELATDSYESRLIQILDSITNDLKTKLFDESQYIEKFDSK